MRNRVLTGPMPRQLLGHLRSWAGAVPRRPGLTIIANRRVAMPGWDGRPELLTGLVAPSGAVVVSLPPAVACTAASLVGEDGPIDVLPALVGRPDLGIERRVYRWTTAPTEMPYIGRWRSASDPAVPEWLRPFGGLVLVAEDADGRHLAGVGIKRHDSLVNELSVVTAPEAQGRGIARMLVAQAARKVLDDGAVPTYLHLPGNVASARVAEAAGFGHSGWHSLALSGT